MDICTDKKIDIASSNPTGDDRSSSVSRRLLETGAPVAGAGRSTVAVGGSLIQTPFITGE